MVMGVYTFALCPVPAVEFRFIYREIRKIVLLSGLFPVLNKAVPLQ